MRSPEGAEEPFAWESRDYLRRKCVGKTVKYQVTRPGMRAGRDYGTVFLEEGNENLAIGCVAEGWCDVKEAARHPSYYDELVRLRNLAKERKIGKWSENRDAGLHEITEISEEDARDCVQRAKDHQYDAIIEAVPNAHTFRVLLKDTWKMVNLALNGASCPSPREPLGQEARYFAEIRLLQRDVRVRFDDLTPQGFLGAVIVPMGDMTLELIRQGFARFTPASIRTLPQAYSDSLRAAEREAQAKKLRIWANWTPAVEPSLKARREYQGKVIEVVSGDTVVVLPVATPQNPHPKEERLSLSSIRAPRLAPRSDENQRHEPWAWEARDFLRRLVIGQTCRVRVEYTRPLGGAPTAAPEGSPQPSAPDREREFASLYLTHINVAERLVAEGLATVQRHKQGEDRALDHPLLQASEEAAKRAGKRLHSREEAPIHRYQVLIQNPRLAKEYRPKFQRMGRCAAVVEYIVTASRYRLYIPSQDCMVSFVLAGVRAPGAPRMQGEKMVAPGEPCGAEALAFARSHLMNREVEIAFESLDPRGNLIGFMYLERTNVAEPLLREGFARIGGGPAARTIGEELIAIEHAARAAKKGLWAFPLPDERPEDADDDDVAPPPEARTMYRNVSVTDVMDGATVCIQIAPPRDAELTAFINQALAQAPAEGVAPQVVPLRAGPGAPQPGDMIAVRHEDAWRRGKIVDVQSPHFLVNEVDYDTEVEVDGSASAPLNMATLPAEYAQAEPCAMCAFLAFIVPPTQEEFQGRATEVLRQLTENHAYDARLEFLDRRKRRYLTLFPSEMAPAQSPTTMLHSSVNALMVRAGLAMADSDGVPPGYEAEVSAMKEEEEVANKAHANIWSYGDIRPDEEDTRRGGRRGGRGGRRGGR